MATYKIKIKDDKTGSTHLGVLRFTETNDELDLTIFHILAIANEDPTLTLRIEPRETNNTKKE